MQKGRVVVCVDPRLYEVQTESGQTVRRNRKHLLVSAERTGGIDHHLETDEDYNYITTILNTMKTRMEK